MCVGKRIHEARKALKLTQKQFAEPLAISRGYIASMENCLQEPSEALIKLISVEHGISIAWLKNGTGEIFISPVDAIKHQMARFGERTIIDAVNSIMKENGLALAAGRQPHRADTGDADLDRLINSLLDIWATGDERLKSWASVQFDIAIPKHVIEEVQKKQKETYGQASAG